MNQHQKAVLGIGSMALIGLLMLHNPISGYVKTERASDKTNDGAFAARIDLCKFYPNEDISYNEYYCDVESRYLVKDLGILEYKSASPAFEWLSPIGNILNILIGTSLLLGILYLIAKPAQPNES